MESSSSDSSHQKSQWKYHVFLSFRGVDTRNGFTDHLYAALKENGILTFRDDEELERGDVISEQLAKAIRESLFAIVILSPKYPFSSWCLDELQEILESRKINGRQAFPVFHGVDPSHVRYQKESFAEAFKKHEERFGKDKVQKWREALKAVANLSGWDSKNRRETELIKQIVEELHLKLRPFWPPYNDVLVGIESKIEDIYSLLRLNVVSDVCFLGIWGMGGVGKTTLTRVVYERVKNQFDASCFLQDVREFCGSQGQGLIELQRKLLSNLKIQGMEIEDSYVGMTTIKNTLCNKRILLVLDDVNAMNQLENLAGDHNWFGPGSRVIVTTRNKQLIVAFKNYEVGLLNSNESLQLFFMKSFKGGQPKEEYIELSKLMVQFARGLPLALKVLGSLLCEKTIPKWKEALDMLKQDALDMLKQDPYYDTLKILKLSYDELTDAYQTIFLDIACFFNGWDKSHVTHILEICGCNPSFVIEGLVERSLLTIDDQNLKMHDLLQDMGKHIVIHKSPNDACQRNRLWSIEDIEDVLAKNKENKAIRGIVLNLSEPIRGIDLNLSEPYKRCWSLDAFSKMCNLKLLILRTSLHLTISSNYLSNALRVLEWTQCPLKSLPPSNQLNNLVDLKLHHSKITQLWSGIKALQKLKFIDLSHSKYLTQAPDISGVPFLETMILKGCIKLVEVPQSTGQHKKLVILCLEGCLNLQKLPKKLEMNSLQNFILSGCSKVKKLPEFSGDMKSLLMLDLKDCKNLHCLPKSINNLKSLKILNISGCLKFSRLPDNLSENVALEDLDASGTTIGEEFSSIVQLKNLQKVSFRGCKGSLSKSWDLIRPSRWFQKPQCQQIPIGLMLPVISQMAMLRELDLSYCNLDDGSIFDNLHNLSSLQTLDLQGNNFVDLPIHSIASLSKLNNLDLRNCARLQSLPMLPPFLTWLGVTGCTSMDFVSYSQHRYDFFASSDAIRKLFFRIHSQLTIPGSEIPTWFDSQNYCSKDFLISAFPESYGDYDSIVSIIVDIPDHCRSSRYWGIALCLALEYTSPSPSFLGLQEFSDFTRTGDIHFTCKVPEADFPNKPSNFYPYSVQEFNYPFLFIDFLPCEDVEEIKMQAICDKDPFELIFWSQYSIYGDEVKSELKIRKCGYRLLWKDNVEMCSNALSDTKRCQQNEVEEVDGTLSISNPRPSKRAKLL